MDRSFESEVREELAVETPLSSTEDFDEFQDMKEEACGNEDISAEMSGVEGSEESEKRAFLDDNRFEEEFEDDAFAELNGGKKTERYYEFDDFELWELGADPEAVDVASAKTRQKKTHFERQRKDGKTQPLGISASSVFASPTTSPSLFNQLQGEVYANLPKIFQSISDSRTKSVLRTVEAALEHTSSPTLQSIGQGIGALLNSLPADEYEALEAMFDWAEKENAIDEAAPAIAHLTVSLMAPKLPSSVRHQLLKSITQATRLLGKRQGAEAARAIPSIVQSVLKTAKRHRISVQALPQKVYRTITQVATNRDLLERLSTSINN